MSKASVTEPKVPQPHSLLAADLVRVLEDAAFFASPARTGIPLLNAVRLESTPKQLIAIATDRFTLGASAANYHDALGDDFNLSLKLSEAQLLVKVGKATKSAFADVCITPGEADVLFEFTSGVKLSLPKLADADEFPDWRKLVKCHNAEASGGIGMNPQYLARFGRVHNSSRARIIFGGPNRPALVLIGAQFVGLVMPVRFHGEADGTVPLPDWLEPSAPPKPAAKARARRASKPKAAA